MDNKKLSTIKNWKNYLVIFQNIKGWYDIKFIKILVDLHKIQIKNNIEGDLLEIGVYQGKSFFPLSFITRKNEVCVAVDCFSSIDETSIQPNIYNQIKPIYLQSNKNYFIQNITKIYGEIPSFIKIKEIDSNLLFDYDYLELSLNKKYRIISIDGGHDYRTCMWDLMRSEEICCSGGFIIIDDYNIPNWIEVTYATNDFLRNNKHVEKYTVFNKRLILRKK